MATRDNVKTFGDDERIENNDNAINRYGSVTMLYMTLIKMAIEYEFVSEVALIFRSIKYDVVAQDT